MTARETALGGSSQPGAEAPPAKLYKYRSLAEGARDFTREIIVDSKLYFASPLTWNDPFDCKPHLATPPPGRHRDRLLQALVNRNMPNTPRHERRSLGASLKRWTFGEMEAAAMDAAQTTLGGLGVCAMSAKRDNILLWSHYADSHRGICLEFKSSPVNPRAPSTRAFKVIYSDDRPSYSILEPKDPTVTFATAHTKSRLWEYENEWRLFREKPADGPGKETFPADYLTGIIFGHQTSEADKAEVRNWIDKRRRPLQLYQAVADRRHFALGIEPID